MDCFQIFFPSRLFCQNFSNQRLAQIGMQPIQGSFSKTDFFSYFILFRQRPGADQRYFPGGFNLSNTWFCSLYFVQLRIAKVKPSRKVPLISTWTLSEKYEIRKEIRLRKAPLYRLHPYLRQSLVRKVLAEQAGREKDLEVQIHVQQLLELLENARSGRRIDLPYNLEAIRDYEGVKIRKKLWNKSIYSENTGLKKMEWEGGKQKNQEATKSVGRKKGNCILQIPGRTAFPGAKAEIICKIIEKNHGFSRNNCPKPPTRNGLIMI